ncbi:hypothetical protein LVD15_16465 [Fulvivirga maritima]|uniref:hypothetical protein n=1 Tax=Fulvivirga maritima TaxID=2904247 RepID=UPI001F3701C9|nr:hypothetical protein [Fulvivirga maritima]UII24893.1 hypothetical protein LVD15_16465 [Fulvivirga maritima]
MSNPFIENSERWLAIANTDYLTLFVKAWIPFNAWYRNSYPSIKTDRETINIIKSSPNLFRDKMLSLLKGRDFKSTTFKDKIGLLYHILEENYIPNADSRISFEEITVERNPDTLKINQKQGWNYKVELVYTNPPHNNLNINILVTGRNRATKYTHSQNKYDVNDLKDNIENSSSLSENQILTLIETYEFINPKKAINLITEKKNGIEAADIRLVNDVDKVAKGIIEILYRLRCILFHGELNPSKENQKAYEPAFYILKTLITSLK